MTIFWRGRWWSPDKLIDRGREDAIVALKKSIDADPVFINRLVEKIRANLEHYDNEREWR